MDSPLVFYKCLADETRLKALLLILQHNELCVCDLTEALGVSQPKISRHLAELRKCSLLVGERRGQWVYYQLSDQLPVWARNVLQQTLDASGEFLAAEQRALEGQTQRC